MRGLRTILGLLSALSLTACAHMSAAEGAPAPLRVMTYNIRLNIESDGENAWPHRKDHVAALIRREAPDLFGTQEDLLDQKQDLEAALPGYAFIGVGRDDGREAGEFSPLAYRRARFDLLQSGTFWLSPTPDRPGKGWDAAYNRIASWALLRDRRSGREIRVLNTHFDNEGETARLESARMLVDWARKSEVPTILMGDFNMSAGSAPYTALTASGTGLRDARAITATAPYGPAGTYNGFDIDSDEPKAIDHVFVTEPLRVERYAVDTQHWGGRPPSDHYPVIVDLELGTP